MCFLRLYDGSRENLGMRGCGDVGQVASRQCKGCAQPVGMHDWLHSPNRQDDLCHGCFKKLKKPQQSSFFEIQDGDLFDMLFQQSTVEPAFVGVVTDETLDVGSPSAAPNEDRHADLFG